jgi:hypothetical protein
MSSEFLPPFISIPMGFLSEHKLLSRNYLIQWNSPPHLIFYSFCIEINAQTYTQDWHDQTAKRRCCFHRLYFSFAAEREGDSTITVRHLKTSSSEFRLRNQYPPEWLFEFHSHRQSFRILPSLPASSNSISHYLDSSSFCWLLHRETVEMFVILSAMGYFVFSRLFSSLIKLSSPSSSSALTPLHHRPIRWGSTRMSPINCRKDFSEIRSVRHFDLLTTRFLALFPDGSLLSDHFQLPTESFLIPLLEYYLCLFSSFRERLSRRPDHNLQRIVLVLGRPNYL